MSRPPSVHKHMARVSLAARLPIKQRRLVAVPGAPAGEQYDCKCGTHLVVDESSTPRRIYHPLPGCAAFIRSASAIGREVRT